MSGNTSITRQRYSTPPEWRARGRGDRGRRRRGGRHRLRACEELGIDPRTQTWEGDSPTAYVLSANLRRRRLTPSQAAAVAVEVLPLLEEEAMERQRAGQASGGRGHRKETPPNDLGDVSAHSGEAVAKTAEACGTNRQYVADAKKIKEADPEAFEAVKRGEKTVPQAKREVAQKAPARLVLEGEARELRRTLGPWSSLAILT